MKSGESGSRQAIRRFNVIGFSLLALLVGGLGVWAATTELAGAVIAQGMVVVESNVKKVQHPTGGVVEKIYVKEGDSVKSGQVVVRLDETLARTTLAALQSQIDELTAREARLIAERDGAAEIAFPPALTERKQLPAIANLIIEETKLFVSRANVLQGQRNQLGERIAQSETEVQGLSAQQTAKELELGLIAKELEGISELYRKNLVPLTRYLALHREKTKLEGDRGQYIAEIAKARGRISETRLQIIQLDRDMRNEVQKDLRDIQARLIELRERKFVAEDQFNRVDIRAPQTGKVFQLTVHTVGGVVDKGEILMLIVPGADALIVEAKVAPQDIDQVVLGAKAALRIQAGNVRAAPDVFGTVTYISADAARETRPNMPQSFAYYVVRISIPVKEIEEAIGIRLTPGMFVEAFIQTHARTPLAYLMKPLREQIARTFRER